MRHLNKAALDIICAVQAFRTFAIYDGNVNLDNQDWFRACNQYYDDIPDALMREAGLVKNRYDFDLVLDFTVTAEIRRTAFFLLDRHVLDPRR
jgi:hypothetical protein